MFDLESFIEVAPFSLPRAEKRRVFDEALAELIRHHISSCEDYGKIVSTLGFDPNAKLSLEEMPFLPVRIFKRATLSSVPVSGVVRTMQSSGTSGQNVSKIFLDKNTAANQTKVLIKIVSEFIGKKRLPMLVLDTRAVLTSANFSARAAGILGFSPFGRDITYGLDEGGNLDLPTVEAFLSKYREEPFLLFGLTYFVWESFLEPIRKLGRKLSFDKAILIHGGGWKKVKEKAVDNATFKGNLKETLGISRVHNYYGMVEQTGSIFMECEQGFLHSSIFSDIVIRDPNFVPSPNRTVGAVELFSVLPHSYPGHILLTEDLGEIRGEDDCACGRLGKYFLIHGRIEKAETRGCSDTLAA